MPHYLVRTDDMPAVPTESAVHVLDWSPGRPEATIHVGTDWRHFLGGTVPSAPAADLMLLGAAIYCADKTASRAATTDAWTRDLVVELPVTDPPAWDAAAWHRPLNFLTGDHWTISGYSATTPAVRRMVPRGDGTQQLDLGSDTVVCLFSGGLDSLAGAIHLLAEHGGRRVVLVGHHEGGQAATAQEELYRQLHSDQLRLVAQTNPGPLVVQSSPVLTSGA